MTILFVLFSQLKSNKQIVFTIEIYAGLGPIKKLPNFLFRIQILFVDKYVNISQKKGWSVHGHVNICTE